MFGVTRSRIVTAATQAPRILLLLKADPVSRRSFHAAAVSSAPFDKSKGQTTLYDFTVPTSDGGSVSLEKFKDKQVALIMNIPTNLDLKDKNFTELEKLHNKFSNKGLLVMAFPCSQFLEMSSHTSAEVGEHMKKHGCSFEIFGRVNVNGDDAHPLFNWLKDKGPGFIVNTVKWNFTKWLVVNGMHVRRYSPTTLPITLEGDIEDALREVGEYHTSSRDSQRRSDTQRASSGEWAQGRQSGGKAGDELNWNTLRSTSNDKMESAKESARDMGDKAKAKTEEFKQDVKAKADEYKQQAREGMDTMKERGREYKQEAREKVDDMKQRGREMKNDAKEKAEDMKDRAKSTMESVKDKAAAGVETVKEKAAAGAEAVKDTAKNVMDKAKEKVEQVKETVMGKDERAKPEQDRNREWSGQTSSQRDRDVGDAGRHRDALEDEDSIKEKVKM